MELNFGINNKTLITHISGEIDHHTANEIREEIDKQIDRNSIRNLVFDFGTVTFMDSSGVGMVIGRYKNIQKLGGKVGIVNLSSQIERVFEISGLFKIIPFYRSVEDALNVM